jgi:hypothetical protein
MSNKAFLFIVLWPGLVFLAFGYLCLDPILWSAIWKGTLIAYLILAPIVYLAIRLDK